MSVNKNFVLIGVAVAALAITALRLAGCGRSARPAAAVNNAYLAALAEGAAEVAAAGASGGRLVALLPEHDGTGAARDRELARLFEQAARRAGFDRVEMLWLGPDRRGVFGGIAAGVLEEVLKANTDARALISLAGSPLSPPARVAAARAGIRVVIVEEDEPPDTDRIGPLLSAKAADAVIRPRGALAADAGRGAPSPREAFQKLFEVKTP